MATICKFFATAIRASLPLPRRGGLVLIALLVVACLVPARAAEARRVKVLTSILPAYSFAANVAGEAADVESLLPPAVGPHDYQFKPRDLQRINAADLIIVNGLELEPWLKRLRVSLGKQPRPVIIELSAGLGKELIHDEPDAILAFDAKPHDHDHDHGHDHHHGPINPHIWLDPRLALRAVTNILQGLQQADPANAARYASNAVAYVARLQTLDADLERAISALKHRNIVTFHNAFPYFTRRYGLKLAGVVEAVPDVSPSPKYLARLGQAIRDRGVKAIFTEPQFSQRLADRLAKDLRVPVAELDTLETGQPRPAAYEEGMRRNLRVLEQHLR